MMARWPQTCLLFTVIITTFKCNKATLELPYEVLDSIVELSSLDTDFRDLARVNVYDARPIYRLDLDPEYVAYYEIDMGSDYIVLSSGRKTGDFRKVESGPDPRPTDVLIQQAQENGQRCEKFYRLSPMGLTICKNDNGTVVASSFNWTADAPEIEDWSQLNQMVKQDLDGFERQWRVRAAQTLSKSVWATTDVIFKGKENKKNYIVAEGLSPGTIVKFALGKRFKSVDVYVTDSGGSPMRSSSRSGWQQKLCKVLVGVCLPDGSTTVTSSAIGKMPNHLPYLKVEVHANRTFVGNVLKWREIRFAVEIKGHKNRVIKKHFSINLNSRRTRRSSWNTLYEVSVPSEKDFPDYDQHICCYGCHSGSGPVAWAQIFGYYDRLAARSSSKFSPALYEGSSKKAPLSMTTGVKKFVETIRPWTSTSCSGGTSSSRMHFIAPWFRARQGLTSRVVSYLERRKKRSNGASVSRISKDEIESNSAQWLDKGFPVVFEIKVGHGYLHFAVATQYKQKSRQFSQCRSTKTGWGWWKKKENSMPGCERRGKRVLSTLWLGRPRKQMAESHSI